MLFCRTRSGNFVLGPPRPLPVISLDRDHEVHLLQHAPHRVGVGELARLVQLPEAERADGGLHVLRVSDRALPPGGPYHVVASSDLEVEAPALLYTAARRLPTMSSRFLPLSSATSAAVRSDCSAAIVARTVLIGLLVPSDLVRMSLTPASSMTARMLPPEITPVPGEAGLSSTLAAPDLKLTSCGMVVPTMGTVTMLRLAISTPLRMASGTSRALPRPAPTRPFMSPTTIRAEKENLRPPLTTLATRLRLTTRSVTSDDPYEEVLEGPW